MGTPTGYGKSLVFQCLSLIRDVIKDELVGTLTALAISPLKSLMMDQVAKLRQTGVTGEAINAGQAEDILFPISIDIRSVYQATMILPLCPGFRIQGGLKFSMLTRPISSLWTYVLPFF